MHCSLLNHNELAPHEPMDVNLMRLQVNKTFKLKKSYYKSHFFIIKKSRKRLKIKLNPPAHLTIHKSYLGKQRKIQLQQQIVLMEAQGCLMLFLREMKSKTRSILKSEVKKMKNPEQGKLKSVMDEFYYSHLLELLFDHECMNGESNIKIKNGNNKKRSTNKKQKRSIK